MFEANAIISLNLTHLYIAENKMYARGIKMGNERQKE